ncbi:rCG53113 [Rattus norvegicus]|uniref:RCG53113 n=1 Tax=Rattus norvegicus TaxID=10116 RepID=A6KPU3_RAT|nr:rCG53113 [Rattus norvegicus]
MTLKEQLQRRRRPDDQLPRRNRNQLSCLEEV